MRCARRNQRGGLKTKRTSLHQTQGDSNRDFESGEPEGEEEGEQDAPVLYDSFKQPFGPDSVALNDTASAPLSFTLVSSDRLGTATVNARNPEGTIAAYVYDKSSNGTFKITESAAVLTQDDLAARLKVHPPSVTDSLLPLQRGSALVESNDGYIEVTLLVGKTQVVVFGPRSDFTMEQAADVAIALAAERV